MKQITFAIPSKGRPDKVETIRNLGLPVDDCKIFVNSHSEKHDYDRFNDCQVISIGTEGIQYARNYILDWFNYDDYIVTLCDDVQGIYRLDGKKKLTKLSYDELIDLIEQGFKACEKYGTKLWGVYPIKNDFYMSNSIAPSGFIIGTFSGIIVNDLRCDTRLQLKEDYDYTIKNILRFEKVVRFNRYCVDAKHYSNKGGCVDYRTKEMEREACALLVGMYPNFVRLNPNRDNEVLLSFRKEK